ncbi:MAG: ATP-binding protein [Clostridia bacterium]|nr:ATP-binding protein [Clostridia bacterium]
MKKTIYRSMCLILTVTILLTTAATFMIYYGGFVENVKKSIRDDGQVLANLLNTCGLEKEKVDALRNMLGDYSYNRITLIGTGGEVVYDNTVPAEELENHLKRPEVSQALTDGRGESRRKSDTMGLTIYYCAYRLEDGSVLRVSRAMGDVYYVFVGIIPMMLGITIAILIFAFVLTKKTAKRIMQPINDINLDKPQSSGVYEELMPFVARIERENAEKEKNEKIRREFSANVSHELKTPLTSITGYAQMINNGMAKKEDILIFTTKIEKEAERLLLLINDIIELSNLDEKGIAVGEDVEVSAVVRDTIASLETAAAKRDVTVYYSPNEAHIKGSRTAIGELAYNIIDNAIKYNKDGGSVTVFVGHVGSRIEFSVKDTGIGIPDEDKERVFERFYRVDKSHSKTVGGTGLGLSIVKHIAMCHNADINVKSELGSGTTISVIFDEYTDEN